MELSPGVRPVVPCTVYREKRNQCYGYAATCSECKIELLAARKHLGTCGATCRQRKCRRLKAEKRDRLLKEFEAKVKSKKGKTAKAKKTPAGLGKSHPTRKASAVKPKATGRGKRKSTDQVNR
jgi:hypothetical protein